MRVALNDGKAVGENENKFKTTVLGWIHQPSVFPHNVRHYGDISDLKKEEFYKRVVVSNFSITFVLLSSVSKTTCDIFCFHRIALRLSRVRTPRHMPPLLLLLMMTVPLLPPPTPPLLPPPAPPHLLPTTLMLPPQHRRPPHPFSGSVLETRPDSYL
jgi:hypothetical protein